MSKSKKLEVKGLSVAVFQANKEDYISLTDIAKSKDGDSRAADIIKNWIRNRGTIEFIGTWEQMHNSNFKVVEFDHFSNKITPEGFNMNSRRFQPTDSSPHKPNPEWGCTRRIA